MITNKIIYFEQPKTGTKTLKHIFLIHLKGAVLNLQGCKSYN